jgi:hypothetical protein
MGARLVEREGRLVERKEKDQSKKKGGKHGA